MTSEISDTPRTRRPETGWARARRLRGKDPVRTCLPAVDRGSSSSVPGTGTEENIVRGVD
ncbi:hypothetical protein BU52_04360 [Streptomyces toyocaensis]|uniref:Uncharacterized protein n=1 Tax=Streptomyces toyocaensis TaxID=55952 RepID=A0A081XXI8_STRTO|nr:hypothetical protein [Streptomyces toyocaensis]KES08261.1 hypothetical protein BU52_04360 [Streptomyces toyocaensis]